MSKIAAIPVHYYRNPTVNEENTAHWSQTNFSGSSRCEQLINAQPKSVRQELEVLDQLTRLSKCIRAMPLKIGKSSNNQE